MFEIISGIIMLFLLCVGIYITVKSGFFQLRGLPFIIRSTLLSLFSKDTKSSRGVSPFQAMTTALAGTMGVGNIAGVATALVSGGPGSIFWMWTGAFFGMMTKYAEIFLAVKYRRRDSGGQFHGGPMYYIGEGLGKNWLAAAFAVLCALSSFGIGNLAQSHSAASAMSESFNIPSGVTGVLAAMLVALVVFGGVRRITRVTEIIIPFISIIYLCFAITFIWLSRDMLGGAFSLIFKSAFGFKEVAGGAFGYTVSSAMRFGLSRGVFTNEAGLGSAPIAHSAADCKSPAHQAAWGIFEVFLDTIIVCTITALVILCAGKGTLWQSGIDGAALTSYAFESLFIGIGGKFVAVSIFLFAVPAMLGWCYYGEEALGYLCGKKRAVITVYRVLFIIVIAAGSLGELKPVWAASDILNALMALPNMLAILFLWKKADIDPARKNRLTTIRDSAIIIKN